MLLLPSSEFVIPAILPRSPASSAACSRAYSKCGLMLLEIYRFVFGVPIQFFYYIYTIICLKSVDVRKLQVAILARSPREMSQTDSILPRYILSRVRISVRPRILLYAKKPQTRLTRRLFISSHVWIRSAAR